MSASLYKCVMRAAKFWLFQDGGIELRKGFVYVRRWKRRKKTKWTLPIFNLLHQRETLKRLNSSKDVGIESSKWISMLNSHQFGPWITWKDSRYSTANEKGISQSLAIDSGFFPIRTFIYRASYSWRSGSSLAIQGSAPLLMYKHFSPSSSAYIIDMDISSPLILARYIYKV
jgi:hypothetical protein